MLETTARDPVAAEVLLEIGVLFCPEAELNMGVFNSHSPKLIYIASYFFFKKLVDSLDSIGPLGSRK